MTCDFCGQNKASVHLIKIVDDEVERIKLCAQCAKHVSMGSDNEILEGIAELMVKMFEGRNSDSKKELRAGHDSEDKKKCYNCGISLRTIKKKGKVGCPECYSEFADILLPLLETIHGSTEYKGKVPLNSSFKFKVEKKIRDLKWRLEEAVIVENFEEAAKLRDRIKRLQKRLYVKSGK
ncbi:MAG: UvrB/UvrC motif-containing protein [Actinomycetota bacterium]